MPQIILKERTAHLVATLFLQEMLIYIETRHYQPPRAAFSQNTYHWLLLSCEFCKVFKNGLFHSTPPAAVVFRYSTK